VRIGLAIRSLRRRRGWTQRELGSRGGCSASQVSRIERGALRHVSIGLIERLLAPLGARLSIRVLWQGEELDRLLDRGHATIVEAVIGILTRNGWDVFPEATFQGGGERGSIDILAWHATSRVLLVMEVKSVMPDIQATLGGIDKKARVAPALARQRNWVPDYVARILVLADDRTSRRRVSAFAETFDRALPFRTAAVKRWLAAPIGPLAGVLFLSDLPRVQARQRVRQRRPVSTLNARAHS
jgi:transcriptional regulator with XRE-family HTH domain